MSAFPTPPQRLGDVFSARSNALNLRRLVLALLVLVSHSWPLGGYGDDPQIGDQNLGSWAVAGFFALSGFLITASALSSRSMAEFALKRFLRIAPGFVVVLLVVAVGIAPLSSLLAGDSYDWTAGARYVVRNLGFVITEPGIAGTLESVPIVGRWNGALWTIAYEVFCYAVIGILITLLPRRLLAPALLTLFLLGTAATTTHVVFDLASDGQFAIRGVRLLTFFCAGALVYIHRQRIPVSRVAAVIAAAVLAASMWSGVFQITAGLPAAYLLLYVGVRLPPTFRRFGARNDLSYGLYIYGWPVQQLAATALLGLAVPLPVYFALVLAVAVPLAAASWLVVERPAQRWGRRRLDRVAPTPLAARTPV